MFVAIKLSILLAYAYTDSCTNYSKLKLSETIDGSQIMAYFHCTIF